MLHYILLEIGGAAENPVSQMATQFGVDGSKLFAQFVIFGAIVFCLNKYAYAPVLTVLEERRRTIETSLANAEKIKQELAQAETARREILQKANDQATALVNDAQKAAQVVGDKKLQEAVAQAEAIIKKAREATQIERDRVLAELKGEVAGLVVETAAKVTGKVLTADDQKRLNDETAVSLRA